MRFSLILFIFFISCGNKNDAQLNCTTEEGKLFSLLNYEHTAIDFRNQLTYTEAFNTYTYRNFYNGGGVGIGDLNNDGLQDIFFCGNMVSNKLYLNKGDLQFQDVTDDIGLNSEGVWSTGVSLADVNGDGWLDIYVCKAGKPEGDNRYNELFINQGVDEDGKLLPFKEMAEDYGIANYGLSTHAAFFDYDKDGDLDMYLLNNSIRSVGHYDLRKNQRQERDPNGGNKLYRNDGSSFTDVSEEAGIYGSAIGYGLGVTIGDVNKDGWPDIFVSNDFFEKDYLYINQKDGSFKEDLESIIGEISLGSMGADMADLNNDGFPEIFVTEMLPKTESRLKTKTLFEGWNKYQENLKNGYYRQFPRNVLQLNRGFINSQGDISMSEISRYAGVEATDWSWGALIADFDNDGNKDLFVANGIYKDLIDLDYLNFYADPVTSRKLYEERGEFLKQLIDKIPSNPVPNFIFKNNGGLDFTDKSSDWGLDCPSFSNGAAYGDLDNDGDLDLVINNVNMSPFIYRNNLETIQPSDRHFITFELKGIDNNQQAIGTQISVFSGNITRYQELAPMRGYQSNVDARLHFGLGKNNHIDSVEIIWPDLTKSILQNPGVDQIIKISQNGPDSKAKNEFVSNKVKSEANPIFKINNNSGLDFKHTKSEFVDFDRDALLFHMISDEGSVIATGDVNGDDLDDVFIGGSKGESAKLFLQNLSGKFIEKSQDSFIADRSSKDVNAIFFDADGDGDLDLYVCSGGNEFPASSSSLLDRLYFNRGNGDFDKSPQTLPSRYYENTSCVAASDFDNDGDVDLFVGVRAKPSYYGVAGNGYLLENNGKGEFKDMTKKNARGLENLGLIRDAKWFDYNDDGYDDLVVVGEWMPVSVFKNSNGNLKLVDVGLNNTHGLWNTIEIADLDNDGALDLVAGNHGLNTRLKASMEKPLRMYVHDFDKNGKVEQILTRYNGEKAYPLVGKSDLVSQLPYLRKKYLNFSSYEDQTIEDIFEDELLDEAIKLKVNSTASSVFYNKNEIFIEKKLPMEAQFSPVYAININDFDNDGSLDILLGGNFHWSKPEVGIYDGLAGLLLNGDGHGEFKALDAQESGVFISGEIRDIKIIKVNNRKLALISRLNDTLIILEKNL